MFHIFAGIFFRSEHNFQNFQNLFYQESNTGDQTLTCILQIGGVFHAVGSFYVFVNSVTAFVCFSIAFLNV